MQRNNINKKGSIIAKCFYVLAFWLIYTQAVFSQNVAINTTLAPANSAAGLDIDFATKGLLAPRVALTGTSNPTPLSANVAGMIVYNTATTGDVRPGLYYNNGSKWIPTTIPAGTLNGDMQYWDGSSWGAISVGQPGQKLQLNSSGIPAWSYGAFSTIITITISSITSGSATSGGNISSDGGTAVTAKGVCWSTSPNPTIANNKTNDGSGSSSFNSNITGLSTGTTYYVRAYSTNASGTSYGNEISFITL